MFFTLKIRLFLYKTAISYLLSSLFMIFCHLCKRFHLYFSYFLYTIMYILNITRVSIKKSVNKIGDFIFENYYKRICFSKENSYIQRNSWNKDLSLLANNLMEKLHDPRNAKEHYQLFIRKNKHKISKTIKNNYLPTKNI